MKKHILSFCLFTVASIKVFAQGGGYENDALRYSQNSISGSSRTQSLAGAGVALGADISAANINPAGLGLYRKSEFSISLSLGSANTNTTFLGSSLRDSRLYAGIPNFGIVFSHAKDVSDPSPYRGGAFAITFTKVNNFQNQFSYSGLNTNNSISNYLVEQANGATPSVYNNDYDSNDNSVSSFGSAAVNSQIVQPIPGDSSQTNYETSYVFPSQKQSETILTKAGQYSWDISYGGNIQDKFYFGAGIGVMKVNYSYEKNFNEYPTTNFSGDLTNINIYDTYSASGYGINIKGGLIFKPTDALRLGISGQSPTYYSINENLNTTFNSTINNQQLPLNLVPTTGTFALTTPAKVTPAIAVFIGKHGFVTGEVSYISYGSSHYSNSPNSSGYADYNSVISSTFKSAYNIRLAGEYRTGIFRIRLGGAEFGDPYRISDGVNRSVYSITAGFGIKVDTHSFDFALINSRTRSLYQPYTLNDRSQPTAFTKNVLTTFNFTYGVNF